jgi:hypothetical protein
MKRKHMEFLFIVGLIPMVYITMRLLFVSFYSSLGLLSLFIPAVYLGLWFLYKKTNKKQSSKK